MGGDGSIGGTATVAPSNEDARKLLLPDLVGSSESAQLVFLMKQIDSLQSKADAEHDPNPEEDGLPADTDKGQTRRSGRKRSVRAMQCRGGLVDRNLLVLQWMQQECVMV